MKVELKRVGTAGAAVLLIAAAAAHAQAPVIVQPLRAEVGQVVLTKTATTDVPVMQFGYVQIESKLLGRRLKFPAQTVRILKADKDWAYGVTSQVVACNFDWAREENCWQATVGVAVARNGNEVRTFDADQLTANRSIILTMWKPLAPVTTRIVVTKTPDPSGNNIMLVYLGRSGTDLRFELRRAVNNGLSAPAIEQLTLTPTSDQIIGVLGARLHIDAVDDFSLSYDVIQSFS
jgi:hypothetical protein